MSIGATKIKAERDSNTGTKIQIHYDEILSTACDVNSHFISIYKGSTTQNLMLAWYLF